MTLLSFSNPFHISSLRRRNQSPSSSTTSRSQSPQPSRPSSISLSFPALFGFNRSHTQQSDSTSSSPTESRSTSPSPSPSPLSSTPYPPPSTELSTSTISKLQPTLTDAETWERMLDMQMEYHCYNSARLEAAVEARMNGVRAEEIARPSRLCLDLLNDELRIQLESERGTREDY